MLHFVSFHLGLHCLSKYAFFESSVFKEIIETYNSNPSCARYWIKNSGKIPYHCNLYPFCIKTVLIFQILFICIN